MPLRMPPTPHTQGTDRPKLLQPHSYRINAAAIEMPHLRQAIQTLRVPLVVGLDDTCPIRHRSTLPISATGSR